MSQILIGTLIAKDRLPLLCEAATPKKRWPWSKPRDGYLEFLSKQGTPLDEYRHPGHYFGTALLYLEDHGINLLESEYEELVTDLTNTRQSWHVVLTPTHRQNYLDRLHAWKAEDEALRKYCVEFYEADSPNHVTAILDAFKFALSALDKLEDDYVAVCQVV